MPGFFHDKKEIEMSNTRTGNNDSNYENSTALLLNAMPAKNTEESKPKPISDFAANLYAQGMGNGDIVIPKIKVEASNKENKDEPAAFMSLKSKY